MYHRKERVNRATFLYCHGNAGNIGHRLENYYQIHSEFDVNILAVEYRSYGDSQNAPLSEASIISDTLACYKYLMNSPMGLNPDKVVIFGRSLGGAVAVALCVEVLEACAKHRSGIGSEDDGLYDDCDEDP